MKKLIVKGQGVLVFPTIDSFLLLHKENDDGLSFKYTNDFIVVYRIKDNTVIISKKIENIRGSFFVSLNAQTQEISVGFGEARFENIIFIYTFDNQLKHFLESIELVSNKNVKIIKDPIKKTIPLLIKENLSMDDIANCRYMPVSALSTICQKLYNCISGKKFVLNTPDFPDFSKAIDYSIKTPGLWCNKKLIEKSNEFGKPNLDETYLRITLGNNNGESPGIPYVMEIWPIGHYSPIHSHSSANAIIRVLRGEINVSLFPFLGADKEFASRTFKKGDITWIMPTLNQTHQLKNQSYKNCVTIQCYSYDEEDVSHYDYFDYIDQDNHVQQYEPDSDMDFLEFKELMKQEWKGKSLISKLLLTGF